MTGPCTAIEPAAAKKYSTGFEVLKARWVSIRWKPTVTPKPVTKYMTKATTRSWTPTMSFQKTTIAARMISGGRTTVSRFAILAVRVMGLRVWLMFPTFLDAHAREIGVDL